ncbi:hypothetical protein DYQ94_05035 [Xanthomonas sp. LMG 8993]|nr:hypothetical protein [Xanthomonas sp. LMG 8993]
MGIGNRESGIGNRESGIGNRESGKQLRAAGLEVGWRAGGGARAGRGYLLAPQLPFPSWRCCAGWPCALLRVGEAACGSASPVGRWRPPGRPAGRCRYNRRPFPLTRSLAHVRVPYPTSLRHHGAPARPRPPDRGEHPRSHP